MTKSIESPTTAVELLEWPIFGLAKSEKQKLLLTRLIELTTLHRSACPEYARLLSARGGTIEFSSLTEIPFFPVRAFKLKNLKSIPDAEVFKTLTSSGTTGQTPSRIFLDRETAQRQSQALVKIMQSFLGKERLPMLIVDHPGVVKDRTQFSARGAGILGISNFGRNHAYALNEDLTLNLEVLRQFAAEFCGARKLIFGFTFLIWQSLYLELQRLNTEINLEGSFLIHGGGWKKLTDSAVEPARFKQGLRQSCGINEVHDFYGMVEQVGSIYFECERGFLHAPAFADLVIRNPIDWSPNPCGEPGVIQVLSGLPTSYPGHSLLTEDIGILHGEDNCGCGRLGKYFSVLGRVPKAEIRGCSDTQSS
jgi:phenylacetate-coenzyme A ligase PaaK-like adenylate-forming protein